MPNEPQLPVSVAQHDRPTPGVNVRIIAGHLVRESARGLEILDTGSPVSMPAPAEAREAIPGDVVGLIGMDELGRSPFLLDWSRGTFTPSAPAPDVASWGRLEMRMGVPVVEIGHAGATGSSRSSLAVLDTGAPISYAPRSAVEGCAVISSATDFYPMFGRFSTDLHEVNVEFLGRSKLIRVGVLPPMLEMALALLAPNGWILGAEFFTGRALWIDAALGRIAQRIEQ